MTRLLKNKAIERLQRALDRIPELQQLRRNSPEFQKWHRDTEVAISNTFGDKTRHLQDFTTIKYTPGMVVGGMREQYFQRAYVNGLESVASVLTSMINEIKEYWEDDVQPTATPRAEASSPETTNEVFVVHGRDEGAKDKVASFLKKLDLQPIVLKEQPNEDRTIIEKFEHHASRVGFAIVLFTPDDVGSLHDKYGEPQPRARQNVVFELGYFIGKLGRDRACALLKGDVGDTIGLLWSPLYSDGREWGLADAAC